MSKSIRHNAAYVEITIKGQIDRATLRALIDIIKAGGSLSDANKVIKKKRELRITEITTTLL